MDEPVGKNDGAIDGVRYFQCQNRFGLFAPIQRVEKVRMNSKESRLAARQSIISAMPSNQPGDSTSDDLNFSDLSFSSNTGPVVQMRTPKKIPIYDSLQSTSILTSIPKQELNDDEREQLERQYQVKVNENERLNRELSLLRQRLEDLQIQLDEYRMPTVQSVASNSEEVDELRSQYETILRDKEQQYERNQRGLIEQQNRGQFDKEKHVGDTFIRRLISRLDRTQS